MFSRAAKSIVKTIGQRKYHAGEENIKLAMIGGAGEIGRSLSQMLKQTSKLDVLALYDMAALNKRFPSAPMKLHTFNEGEAINSANSKMLKMLEKSRSSNPQAVQESIKFNQNETQELVESLRCLPIAEECAADQLAKPSKIGSQGHNAYTSELRGPRVLGEIGPGNIRHGGRIVSEICRRFPDLTTYLSRNCSSNANAIHARRGYSNVAFLTHDDRFAIDLDTDQRRGLRPDKPVPDLLDCLTRRNSSTMDRAEKKRHSRKKDTTKLIMALSEHAAVKDHSREADCRTIVTQKCDKRRIRAKKANESKINEEIPFGLNKHSTSSARSKNWTIPAALSDKKPRMLYGLVQHRRRPITWFFSKLFDVRYGDGDNNYQKHNPRYKLACVQAPRMLKQLNKDERHSRSDPSDKLNVSTSMSDLAPEPCDETSRPLDETSRPIDTALEDPNLPRRTTNLDSIEERTATSSIVESEYDVCSEINVPKTPVRRISSRIAQFLENLSRINERKSRSLSSLASYNLDSLFVVQETPALIPVLFSSSDRGSKNTLKDKICSKICGKKGRRDDDICKKRETSCKTGKDECKKSEPTCPQKRETSCKTGKDACKKTEPSCPQKRDTSCKTGKDACKKTEPSCPQKRDTSCKTGKDACKKTEPSCPQRRDTSCKTGKDACKKTEPSCPQKRDTSCKTGKDACKKTEPSCPQRRDTSCKTGKDACKKTEPACPQRREPSCKRSETSCPQRRETSCKTGKDECKRTSCKQRDDSCKKTGGSTGCGDGDNDPCKPYRHDKDHGAPCKMYKDDKECGNQDPCKKYWKQDTHGKRCKGGDQDDPCKKLRKPEIYGKLCKEYTKEHGKEESCDKLWNDDTHGTRCKKDKKKKKKKKKKQQPDFCKERSCATDTKKEKPKECGLRQEKPKDCPMAGKSEKTDKCPPVIRAPGCPKDDGKSSGSGNKCRRYSTVASKIDPRNNICRKDNVPLVDVSRDIVDSEGCYKEEFDFKAKAKIDPFNSSVFVFGL